MDDAMLNNQGKGDVAGFTEVDQAPDARYFVEFLDAANALPDVQTLKTVMVDELRLSPRSSCHQDDRACSMRRYMQ